MRAPLLAATVALSAALVAEAIVIRHDRDDRDFLAQGLKYPSTVMVNSVDGKAGAEGTLIDPRWVLTAAHVADEVGEDGYVDAGGRKHSIRRIVKHPDWHGVADVKFDIALVALDAPVTGIEPAKLYTGSDEAGMIVTFVGRGGTGTGLTGPVMQDGHIRAATNRVESAEGSQLRFRFDAPEDPGVTPLEGISGGGDSGGPAFVERDGVLYIVGVSVGQDSAPADRKRGHYKVIEFYARISYFAPWIRGNIRADVMREGFFGYTLLLLGAIAAFFGVLMPLRARGQFGWEAVPGTVTASRVRHGWFSEPDFRAEVEYTYSYRGREFRGTKVKSLEVLVNWPGPARRSVAKYPPGAAVDVFVNPQNPRDAVLERGGDPKFLLLMLSISAFFLLPAWLVLT